MVKSIVASLVAFAVLGCVEIPTAYTKSVTVEKDAAGNVLKVIEMEGVIQQGRPAKPIEFKHLTEYQQPKKDPSSETPRYD